jgi:hypothetical protein
VVLSQNIVDTLVNGKMDYSHWLAVEPNTTTIRQSNQNLYEIKSSLLHPIIVALAADATKLDQVIISDPFSLRLRVSWETNMKQWLFRLLTDFVNRQSQDRRAQVLLLLLLTSSIFFWSDSIKESSLHWSLLPTRCSFATRHFSWLTSSRTQSVYNAIWKRLKKIAKIMKMQWKMTKCMMNFERAVINQQWQNSSQAGFENFDFLWYNYKIL